jgi:hypothetical protein
MKRRFSIRSLITTVGIILGVGIAIFVVGNVISFLSTRDRLPQTTYLGDVDVSGLGLDDAISRTVTTLQTPVTLRYQTNIIQLQPSEIDFQLNDVVARLQLQAILDGQQGLGSLPNFALRRSTEHRSAAPYQYSDTKLDDFLSQLTSQYDQQPSATAADSNTLSLTAAQSGTSLNQEQARQQILAALASGTSRVVDLPVDVVPGENTGMQALSDLIKSRVEAYNTNGNVAGVFIKDLKTGQELTLNSDVAFSAQGWLKMAIVLEAYRALSDTISGDTAQQLASLVVDGNTATANQILQTLGAGDAQAGTNQLNDMLKRMGLVSTFLAQPFDQTATPTQFITPGNTRTDVSASPDANAQSTPAEVGVILEMLDQCHANEGALPLIFPDVFTSARCDQVLNVLAQNSANVLISANSPGATVIHRQSWDANNHGDAALVSSPGGTYVIVVMLHGTSALNWADTSQVIGDIARAVYGYFNNGQVPASTAALNAAPPP